MHQSVALIDATARLISPSDCSDKLNVL